MSFNKSIFIIALLINLVSTALAQDAPAKPNVATEKKTMDEPKLTAEEKKAREIKMLQLQQELLSTLKENLELKKEIESLKGQKSAIVLEAIQGTKDKRTAWFSQKGSVAVPYQKNAIVAGHWKIVSIEAYRVRLKHIHTGERMVLSFKGESDV